VAVKVLYSDAPPSGQVQIVGELLMMLQVSETPPLDGYLKEIAPDGESG